jgi:hypothetical protein
LPWATSRANRSKTTAAVLEAQLDQMRGWWAGIAEPVLLRAIAPEPAADHSFLPRSRFLQAPLELDAELVGGFLTAEQHALALEAHPVDDVIVVGDVVVLEDEGPSVSPETPVPLRQLVLAQRYPIDSIQADPGTYNLVAAYGNYAPRVARLDDGFGGRTARRGRGGR